MHEINIKTLAVEIDDYDEANQMESGDRNWGRGERGEWGSFPNHMP